MDIKPFRALRPVRDKVHLVATRPFYTYKKNVLKAKLQSNPYSFLHIINPDFEWLQENSEEMDYTTKLELVHSQYEKFIEDGVLIRDEEPTMYVYRQSKNDWAYTGVIASTSVQNYNEGRIKKHEATLTQRQELFTKYLDIVGYNAEPVLLCHENISDLDLLLEEITSERPEYEFTTTDQIKHELWVMSVENGQKTSGLFKGVDACYIADGHHRSASSAALFDLRLNKNQSFPNDGYFLSFLIDESKLKVFEYNRMVRTTNEFDKKSFLEALLTDFNITRLERSRKPVKQHEFIMLVDSNWYSLVCKPQIIKEDHPVKSLDADILTHHVLTPLLGIHDLKTDENIGFISGTESTPELLRKMAKGGFSIAFLLFPVTMDQVKTVADNNMTMPPKSTWVEPKMRSGLTIYPINE